MDELFGISQTRRLPYLLAGRIEAQVGQKMKESIQEFGDNFVHAGQMMARLAREPNESLTADERTMKRIFGLVKYLERHEGLLKLPVLPTPQQIEDDVMKDLEDLKEGRKPKVTGQARPTTLDVKAREEAIKKAQEQTPPKK